MMVVGGDFNIYSGKRHNKESEEAVARVMLTIGAELVTPKIPTNRDERGDHWLDAIYMNHPSLAGGEKLLSAM